MDWKLFLDDCRDAPEGWVLARSVKIAEDLVLANGFPVAISFDHDMEYKIPDGPPQGKLIKSVSGWFRENAVLDPTGLDFAKWIASQWSVPSQKYPEGFVYYIHSANKEGARLIYEVMKFATGNEPAGWQDWWKKEGTK
jgi:hypothetical protein